MYYLYVYVEREIDEYRSENFFEQILWWNLEHKFHVRYLFDLSVTVFDMINP
jgi:hypothetical protein